jgi:hypothetical protein
LILLALPRDSGGFARRFGGTRRLLLIAARSQSPDWERRWPRISDSKGTPFSMHIPTIPLPLDVQHASLWSILLVTVFGVYFFAAAVGAFALKWKPWKRFVPLVSVAILFLPRVSHLLGSGKAAHGVGSALHTLSLVVFPVLVIWTFFLAWSGRQPIERVLRIASGILGGYYLWLLFGSLA